MILPVYNIKIVKFKIKKLPSQIKQPDKNIGPHSSAGFFWFKLILLILPLKKTNEWKE